MQLLKLMLLEPIGKYTLTQPSTVVPPIADCTKKGGDQKLAGWDVALVVSA